MNRHTQRRRELGTKGGGAWCCDHRPRLTIIKDGALNMAKDESILLTQQPNTEDAPAAQTAKDLDAEVRMLRDHMHSIQGLADSGLNSIRSVAILARLAFEGPEAYRHPELIFGALRTIQCKAEMTLDLIYGEAEQAGSDYVGPGEKQRIAAEMYSRGR